MKQVIKPLMCISILALLSVGCQMGPQEVEFIRITDQGVAIFEVNNLTDQDYTEMEFEVSYLNGQDEVILIDTLHYEVADDLPNQIFLEANGQTMFSQTVPENTVSATGRIISAVNE